MGTGSWSHGRGAARSGQEEPYQGGDEDHTERDQQQTGVDRGEGAETLDTGLPFLCIRHLHWHKYSLDKSISIKT